MKNYSTNAVITTRCDIQPITGIRDTTQVYEPNPHTLNQPPCINLGTMFSGIGAIEYALKRLNRKTNIIFASDIDKFVKQSYFANYNINERDWFKDVADIKGKKYKGVIDILVAGIPCQPFSTLGKRKGFDDPRGNTFFEFARVLKESNPKAFILENVKGLLHHDKGTSISKIKTTLEELGYHIYYKVLNAVDYGIPQHRERLFVVGFKNQYPKFEFPTPIPLTHKVQDFLETNVDKKYYLSEKGVKSITTSFRRKKKYCQINGEIAICQKANQQNNWQGDFIFESRETTEAGEYIFNANDCEENYYAQENPTGRLRKLTPRECLRLMGFKDDFKQVVSDSQMYKQTGNSIVVDVLIAILNQIY